MANLNLIFLGPPGAGKGTQATRLAKDFNLPYIATGDMLRAAVKAETELGRKAKEHMDRGGLVPDELIVDMLREQVENGAGQGFILDGFPRTPGQAEALAEMLEKTGRSLSAVLLIEVADEEIVRRISGRRVCVKNGHTFHVEFDPPKHEDVCDKDGSRLVLRDDDRPNTVRKRLQVYHDETFPLVEHYEGQGSLRRFDGTRTPAEVHDRIRASIATLRFETSA